MTPDPLRFLLTQGVSQFRLRHPRASDAASQIPDELHCVDLLMERRNPLAARFAVECPDHNRLASHDLAK